MNVVVHHLISKDIVHGYQDLCWIGLIYMSKRLLFHLVILEVMHLGKNRP